VVDRERHHQQHGYMDIIGSETSMWPSAPSTGFA